MNETAMETATATKEKASFRSAGTSAWENARSSRTIDPYFSLVGRGLDQGWSSSLREDSWEHLQRSAFMFLTPSASESNVFGWMSYSSHTESLRASVSAADAHGNFYEIRRLTGFNWTRLAEMLNVDRRTIHNWVKGGQIRKANRHRVAETLKVLRFADRGSAELNAAALEKPSMSGLTALDLIKAAQYANAQNVLGEGASRARGVAKRPDTGFSTGTFRPIVTHDGADGSEFNGPFPEEPMPRSRKRRLDRGRGVED